MDKLEFMKLGEGDIIYVPYVITERRGEDLVEAVSPAILDEGQEAVEFCHRDVRCAEKKRRRFRRGDFVRAMDGFGNTYESRVMQDEGNDGLVELACTFEPPLLVDHADLQLLVPEHATGYLPVWGAEAAGTPPMYEVGCTMDDLGSKAAEPQDEKGGQR